jgi:tRNA(adenine34) deaminase
MKVMAPRLRTFPTQPAKITVSPAFMARRPPQVCVLYIIYLNLQKTKVGFSMETDVKRDEKFMRAALKEAQAALEKGEVPIGAVIVCGGSGSGAGGGSGSGAGSTGGTIIARGHNMVETLVDATAHAEMQAITAASAELGGKYLTDCTLYVTVEPCVMCAGAMAWAQVGRLVYGAADPKRGYSNYVRGDGGGGGKSLLHPKTEVTAGVLAEECAELVTDFFRKLRV